MEIINNYRDNRKLRDSFNELATKVFGLNFENWYRNGFWNDNYNPFSVVIDGKVVSNVSVNRCDMKYNGSIIHLIQLGTVMTDPEYRGKGYSRLLMEEIMKEYENKVDGIYLFANDSVLDFYPKFGFRVKKEFQYSKVVSNSGINTAKLVKMNDRNAWDRMVEVMKNKPQNGNMVLVGNEGLFMFYLSQFMQENVYYIPECDSYAVADVEDEVLTLHAIFGTGNVNEVIASFGNTVKKAVLCFTPMDTEGFDKNELQDRIRHCS